MINVQFRKSGHMMVVGLSNTQVGIATTLIFLNGHGLEKKKDG